KLLFSYIDDVMKQFNVSANVRVFKAKEMGTENAMIMAQKNNILLIFCDNILNLIEDERELKSIIGHEFGHYLYKHMENSEEEYLMRITDMTAKELSSDEKKFIRNPENNQLISLAFIVSQIRELNADRIGLFACQDLDAAIISSLKLTAGNVDKFGKYDPQTYIAQAESLIMEGNPFDEDDIQITHPQESLRAYALNYFYHSDVFKELTGKGSGTNKLSDFNKILHHIIYINPIESESSTSASKISKPAAEKITQMDPFEYELFRYMAVHHVVSIDGKITKAESELLCNFIKEDEIYNKVLDFSENTGEAEYKKTYESLAKKACGLDSRVKTSIIKLMIKAAKADRKIADEEIGAIIGVAQSMDADKQCRLQLKNTFGLEY
ncbi:MAG TPA: M48 family metalloprotease, partial [Leptospiraceae bacterium]|nr:M48 family metalloprotease [Leptospiraceae bacterium]